MSKFLYTSVGDQLIKISSLTPRPRVAGAEDGPAHQTRDVNNITEPPSVLAESFRFSTKSGSFEPKKNKAILPIDSTSRLLRLIALSNVVDDLTGLKMPCVVVETETKTKRIQRAGDGGSSNRVRIIIILLSVQKWKFMVYGSISLGYSLSKLSNVGLADGPTLSWEHQRCLCITCASPRSNGKKVDVINFKQHMWKPSNTLKWFGMVHDDAVAIGMEKQTEADGHSSTAIFDRPVHKWTVVRLHDTQPTTDSITIMPHEYSNIVTCIHFSTMSQWGGRLSREVVWAATNQFQLVEAKGGVVQRVCSLPFGDSCRISVAMVSGAEELIVVQSTSGKMCAVWRKSFEVAVEWAGYHTVLVGDFMSFGAEQVLLLGGRADAYRERFLLTDLGSCNWMTEENGETALPRNVPCAENLLSAVQALEAQIQTGMAALRSSEKQYDRKEQLILQAQDALYKMAAGQESPTKTPHISLTCFCDLSGKDEDAVEMDRAEHGTLRSLGSWQRIVANQWIVGVEVCNQTGRNISNITASLIPIATSQTSLCSAATSVCKVKSVAPTAACTLPNPSRPSTSQPVEEPVGKRLKTDSMKNKDGMTVLQPGPVTTLIATTNIPEFQSGSIAKFDVMLKWSESSAGVLPEGVNRGPATLQSNRANRMQSCGTVVLHVSDLVTGKLEVKPLDAARSASQYDCDMQALDALQLATSLIVTSKCSNLLCLDGLLRGPMGFQSLRGQELICPHGLLSLMRVQILASEGPHRRRVVVHSRDQSDLLLLCQHLYQLLPDDVIIKPLQPVNQVKTAIATALQAIDKELSVTCKHLLKLSTDQFSSMLRGHGVNSASSVENGVEGGNMNQLGRVRGDFEAERGRVSNGGAPVEVAAPDVAKAVRQEQLRLRNITDESVGGLACVL
ncbi:uncharacterized protein [Asterias amurensis]|uniref:uncharacterized protein n=1 Tax=Asterias amurensis TaxID=7602 RepID=UPI003AB35B04